ncbi:hypothetical protein NKG05_21475 [Oerskovia sp. M15]
MRRTDPPGDECERVVGGLEGGGELEALLVLLGQLAGEGGRDGVGRSRSEDQTASSPVTVTASSSSTVAGT